MEENTKRHGRQTPGRSYVAPYSESRGEEAIRLYETSKYTLMPWQGQLIKDLLSVNSDGLWHVYRGGFSIARQNGKTYTLLAIVWHRLLDGCNILFTAHRTSTSSEAFNRLQTLLIKAGYEKLGPKPKRGEKIPKKSFRAKSQKGQETIEIAKAGKVRFSTRTDSSTLGESFDLVVCDEAAEMTEAQFNALKYTVSARPNPQIIMSGTPPRLNSPGTVFADFRNKALSGESPDNAWFEWGADHEPDDIMDTELWYECCPSLGYYQSLRGIRENIDGDRLDFIIQGLGYWHSRSLKSEIAEKEWKALQLKEVPDIVGKAYAGIKFHKANTSVSLSIAARTDDGRIFVESIGCRPIKRGTEWIVSFLKDIDLGGIMIDGKNGAAQLADALKDGEVKAKPVLPSLDDIIESNSLFMQQGINEGRICHMGQKSLAQAVTNCTKRQIGQRGGFGFESLNEKDIDITLVDSAVLAYYQAAKAKRKKRTWVSY